MVLDMSVSVLGKSVEWFSDFSVIIFSFDVVLAVEVEISL